MYGMDKTCSDNPNSLYNPLAQYVRSKLEIRKQYINDEQLKKAIPLQHPKYYLALVAIFQNEARFLKEWIEFYKMLGVEHFYLYNHLSTDEYKKVLEPYITSGLVTLQNVTESPKSLKQWNTLQTSIYTEVINDLKDTVEWLIIVDTDEFLFPIKESNLSSILHNYDEYAALSVNWVMYGSGNVTKLEQNELLIDKLRLRGPKSDTHVKSIVKPRYVQNMTNPHFPNLLPGYAQITENYVYFIGPFSPYPSSAILRINHYWARDQKFFNEQKLHRVHILNNKQKEEKIQELNTGTVAG